jgi:hypothetical protein
LATSLGGSYEDMICYIPTSTLNWSSMMTHFQKVLEALIKVGFSVVLILCDGHKINVKFFIELGNGSLELSVPNPFNSSMPIFTMFDPVHLFKNFYHNFERKR